MSEGCNILIALAEESATSSAWNTPAWIIGIVLLNFVLTVVVGIILLLTKSGIDKQRDDMNRVWKRFEEGEETFTELRGKDAEVAVQMERKTGRVYERLNTMFTTKEEHRDLAARVYAMELGMAKEITSIHAGIDRLTNDLGVIADEFKQQRQERTKQQQANEAGQKS